MSLTITATKIPTYSTNNKLNLRKRDTILYNNNDTHQINKFNALYIPELEKSNVLFESIKKAYVADLSKLVAKYSKAEEIELGINIIKLNNIYSKKLLNIANTIIFLLFPP